MRRSAGFSLLELMIVITILGIFAAFAFPGLQYLSHSTQVKSASSALYAALLQARSEAVKRNGPVTVTPTDGLWRNGWTIKDNSGNVLVTQPALKGVKITSNITTNLVYLSSGRIQGAVSPTFSIIHTTNATDQTVKLARCVSAQPNGSPYVKSTTCS